jgi:mono/diheme cytochrome c family protein
MNFKTWNLTILGLAVIVACWSALRAQDSERSIWDGVYTQEQAKMGQAEYNQQCAPCHSDTLAGGDEAPPLAGGAFLSNWNGLTVGDLFERIRTTMPLGNPQDVNRETKARILAYILNVNRFPTGAMELSSRTEVLKLIRIDAEQPKK